MQKLSAHMYAVSIAPNPNYLHGAGAREEGGIPPEDGRIPQEHEDLKEGFRKIRAQAVPKHSPQDLAIDLNKGKDPT